MPLASEPEAGTVNSMMSQKVDHKYAPVPMFASAVVECSRRAEALGAASEKDAIDLAINTLYGVQGGEHDMVLARAFTKEFGVPTHETLATFWSVPDDLIPDKAIDLPMLYNTHRPDEIATGVSRLESCHHVNLAYFTAHRVARKHERDADELVAMAYIGLQSALGKYNPRKGFTVSTFVTQRIWGSIQDGIRNDSPVPKALTAYVSQVKAVEEALTAELLRKPTFNELKEALGPDADRLHLYPRLLPQVQIGSMEEYLQDVESNLNLEQQVADRESQRIVQAALATLTREEMLAVRHVHMDGLSVRQAARQLKCTQAALSADLESGLSKLRAVPEIVGLDPSGTLSL